MGPGEGVGVLACVLPDSAQLAHPRLEALGDGRLSDQPAKDLLRGLTDQLVESGENPLTVVASLIEVPPAAMVPSETLHIVKKATRRDAMRHRVDGSYTPDADRMYAALCKIARYPDFPPSEWPAGTDPEHMWNEMVTIARVCLCGVDIMQELRRKGRITDLLPANDPL